MASSCFSQQAFRLHVQSGKPQLVGDGDDFTTLVITARDSEGEIITSMNGKVKVGVSSGFPDQTEVRMESGVALVKFTAPMFGTPVKSSQRMVYFMFRFMQKFIGRSSGSTDYQANQKMATDIALETFKEGLNPITLIPKGDGDNFVYIVCEMNGVKGKAKIEISKAADGRNGSIVPGVYYGRDITGQSEWVLDITSGGEGYFGEANASSNDQVAILFSNEDYSEFNDAMGKMAGMTGFKKAYLGPPASEQKYYENYDIRTSGMSSAYMPMPNHGVFVYVPPILFEYAGRRSNNERRDDGAAADKEELKTEKTGIILSQNEIIGDGRSRTKAVFHFEDENGKPLLGKSVSWEIPKGLKILSMETVTNPSGNAVVEFEAPVIKAAEEKRGENLHGLYDNYNILLIKASYSSLNGKTENTQAQLKVYKTLEQEIFILKPGMEITPYKVLLPQLEYYNLESSIYALLPESYMTIPNRKTPVNDAVVFLTSRNFDRAEFQKKYDLFFLKDRKMFLQMLERKDGGYAALTDASGKYKLIVRDFEGKMRLYSGDYDRKLNLEPLEAKIADLTGRHKGALTEALSLLAGGDAAVLASDNEGESSLNQSLHSLAFKEKVLAKLLNMEKELCSGNYQEALYVQEKLHIIGMLMTNIKGSSRYVSDCANVFGEQAYEAIKFLVFFAAEKYKFNDKLFNKLGNTESAQKLKAAGIDLSGYIDNSLKGISEETAKKSLATQFLLRIVAEIKQLPGDEYYKLLGHAANYALTETQKKMLDGVVDAVVYYSPTRGIIGEMIVKKYYAGQTEEVLKLLDQDPRKVHAVYEQLQPALRDRSTEIRQQYSNVAAWRLNLDDFKAYTDLFADLVAKGAVIIVDAYSGNYAAIQKHLEYIDNAKNVLNAAYHTASLGNEFVSLRNLWAESDAALIYANKCIEQGSMSPITENRSFTIPLFPSAMAANESGVALMKGVPAFSANQLSLKNGRLPVNELNQMFNGFGKFNQWFSQYEDELLWISVDDPELATQLFKAREAYNDQLEVLTVLSMGIIEKPEDAYLKTQWKEISGQMEKTSAEIIKTSGEATDKMKTMEANPPVNIPDKTMETISVPFSGDKTITYLLVAAGGLIVIVVLGLFIRKKRREKVNTQPLKPNAPSQKYQQLQTKPLSEAEQVPLKAKFCSKCGNQLKPDARYCGKCGNLLK
jgi:ribosomal protein L40E